MKIYGVGVDIIENSRIKKLIKKKIFLRRIFSKAELKITKTKNNKISFLAKRFSAKEAFVKSLGSGFRNNLCFNDITILNDKKGKPYFKFNQKIKKILKKKYRLTKFKVYLSLSDEKKYSISYVVLHKLK
tara:strand:- start:1069 stop:1458 length:390 start_codon:yes stop_codon:yes gene_type:complete